MRLFWRLLPDFLGIPSFSSPGVLGLILCTRDAFGYFSPLRDFFRKYDTILSEIVLEILACITAEVHSGFFQILIQDRTSFRGFFWNFAQDFPRGMTSPDNIPEISAKTTLQLYCIYIYIYGLECNDEISKVVLIIELAKIIRLCGLALKNVFGTFS